MKIAKVKEEARSHEQNEEWKQAIDLYEKVIEATEAEDDPDLAVYNRVGDLYVRLGETGKAVEYYDRAVDLYLESDLAKNAIALCKKILRNVPGRAEIYLRLGKICAREGFLTDARQNFLEYAERMQDAGDMDAAFRALKEFAELVPEDTDIRTALAEQLIAHEREEEAAAQLAVVHGKHVEAGEGDLAAEIESRIRELAPDADLEALAAEAGPSEPAPTEASEALEMAMQEAAGDDEEAGAEADDEIDAGVAEIEIGGEEEGDEEAGEGDLGFQEIALDDESGEEPGELPGLDDADDDVPDDDVPGGADDLPLMDVGEELEAEPAGEAPGEEEAGEVELEADLEADLGTDLEADLDVPEDEEEPGEPGAEIEAAMEEEAADVGVEAEDVVERLRGRLDENPDDHDARVKLGEELLERGDRDEGVELLHDAHRGYSREGDLGAAMRVVRELISMEPDNVRLHQKLVEYAFRTNDEDQLIPAYLDLASALERNGSDGKAGAVYQRILDLDPSNEPARNGLAAIEGEPVEAAEGEAAGDYVDLGSLVFDEEEEKTTRFVVAEDEPSGDEQADFSRMLARFKNKVSENITAEDTTSHYDLGVAYKEMGLLDEAIGEFQQALRGGGDRLKTTEMLGQCFFEKGQYPVSAKVLKRAEDLPHGVEDDLLAVYYYLGRSYEEMGETGEAVDYYEKVFGIDINFRDVTDRLGELRE